MNIDAADRTKNSILMNTFNAVRPLQIHPMNRVNSTLTTRNKNSNISNSLLLCANDPTRLEIFTGHAIPNIIVSFDELFENDVLLIVRNILTLAKHKPKRAHYVILLRFGDFVFVHFKPLFNLEIVSFVLE